MKVCAIGGGTGLSTLLRGLKRFSELRVTAVVTITDEGGSSGVFREEMNIPPPGDIRNNIVALAEDENLLTKTIRFRFEDGNTFRNHSVGNIVLAALTRILGSFPEAVKNLSDVLAIQGRVLPVSGELVRLVAQTEEGGTLVGENAFASNSSRIVSLQTRPVFSPLPEVLQALEEADGIVLGPGSLYTSVLPNLLARDVCRVINANPAPKVYIANIMTQPGETNGFTLSDHVREICRYLQGTLQFVVANSRKIPPELVTRYAQKGAIPVELDMDKVEVPVFAEPCLAFEVDERDHLKKIRHDSQRLGELVYRLLKWREKP
ncbi:MAG TPA: YvcK family protein [Thermotogota bacterium]|nr:YvcK family protein [Thermotogota bacterium]HRW91899.1 YvcK family protein [Thermotogota bacterium]